MKWVTTMKKLILTALFGFYHFFIPFVLVNCGGEDIPYDKSQVTEAELEANEPDCEDTTLTTLDCALEEETQ